MWCKFKEATFHACGKKGHIKRVCRSKRKTTRRSKQTKWIDTDQQEQDSGDEGNSISNLFATQNKHMDWVTIVTQFTPVQLSVLNGNPCDFEVDTGAAVSILSEKQLNRVLPGAQLKKMNVSLRTYTSQKIPIKGKLDVEVQYMANNNSHLPVTS